MLNHLTFPWPVATPAIRDSILQAVDGGDWGKYHGQFTDEFVARFCNWLGVEHTTLCCSGTIAVELALRGVGVRLNDEVILAGYDFPGNFRSIEAIGALPVLVDVVSDGWVLDPNQVAAAVSESTKAIVVSHLHGQIANIAAIKSALESTAHGQNVAIVEDVCQSPGGTLTGKPLGTFGDVSVFSFGGSKLLSAGRGGAVATNDPAIAQRIKVFSERGNDSFPLSQLQAAALIPQLDQLNDSNKKRLAAAKFLCKSINSIQGLATLPESDLESDNLHAIYKVPIRIESDKLPRDAVLARFCDQGMPIGESFRGFYRRSKRRCRKVGDLEHSKTAAEQTMLLHHPALLKDIATLDLIVQCIKEGSTDS
jgi:dTDP-4-amino-4,6-dideoxygalactose transaminase